MNSLGFGDLWSQEYLWGRGGTSIFFENNISCFKECANKRTYKNYPIYRVKCACYFFIDGYCCHNPFCVTIKVCFLLLFFYGLLVFTELSSYSICHMVKNFSGFCLNLRFCG